jgi:DNA mismatch repair protein MutS
MSKENQIQSTSRDSTPLMEQYLAIKANYQDMILLYRMGDFYETFYKDAELISKILGIALTKRSHGKVAHVPLAGFPYHALDAYLPKLIQAGHKVAICEQVEDPKLAKTVVKRKVIEVVTPGTAISDKILEQKKNNYLAAIHLEENIVGISYCDISTGEFYLSEITTEDLIDYLQEINPKEILIQNNWFEKFKKLFDQKVSGILTKLDDWLFTYNYAYEILISHFQVPNLKGFGAEDFSAGIIAAGAILHYSKDNYQNELSHIGKLSVFSANDYMILDATTRRNLEITSSILGTGAHGTLLSVLDHTLTPMGSRLLKQIITQPLIKLQNITDRLNRVDVFVNDDKLRGDLQENLENIGDIERLLARISTGRASPRDLIAIKNALQYIQPIKELLINRNNSHLQYFSKNLENVESIIDLVENSIKENPPLTLTEGNIIKEGYNKELDELYKISSEGKKWIIDLQNQERQKTRISTLKIGFNKVFGYYIEITKTHAHKVPDYFIRKQTLVNSERYITPELKEYEEKILHAEEKMAQMEYELFREIREEIAKQGQLIQKNARIIAELDCVTNFAHIAVLNNYIKPEIDDGDSIEVINGRHPVVENLLALDQPFIANDTQINNHDTQIMVITGPNMSGKSTYLRQVGLIILMAQIGSFIPAERAKIGVVDRIFTRVGASDNLAFGESTFMVEMLEAANILNNASPKSLVLLDEIGRGTSTFDGLSIAWAVTEYIHNNKNIAAKTLFATHYHELTELAMIYPKIKNYKVSVQEYGDKVVFLRKIEPGGMDNSYGIYVAQMAGLPREVVERAKEVLYNLEANELSPNKLPKISNRRVGTSVDKNQLNLFGIAKKSPLEEELEKVDINSMTPLEAIIKLQELKKIVSSKIEKDN